MSNDNSDGEKPFTFLSYEEYARYLIDGEVFRIRHEDGTEESISPELASQYQKPRSPLAGL